MDIGNKIKQLRTRQGLTLEELASRSELTKGFLSQLERDLTSPSIDSLSDILEALGTNLSEFFQEDKNDQFVFRSEDFFRRRARELHRQLDRSQHAEKPDGAHFIGTSAGGESFEIEPHNGEEFGYVLDGSVILECDGERSVVCRGETFYLHGRTFHYLKNERKTTARILWVCTPPLF